MCSVIRVYADENLRRFSITAAVFCVLICHPDSNPPVAGWGLAVATGPGLAVSYICGGGTHPDEIPYPDACALEGEGEGATPKLYLKAYYLAPAF